MNHFWEKMFLYCIMITLKKMKIVNSVYNLPIGLFFLELATANKGMALQKASPLFIKNLSLKSFIQKQI